MIFNFHLKPQQTVSILEPNHLMLFSEVIIFFCENHKTNKCRYQSITQHYLKICLIKDDNNYMFRPIAAIIRFSSKSMIIVLYRIGMVMSRW